MKWIRCGGQTTTEMCVRDVGTVKTNCKTVNQHNNTITKIYRVTVIMEKNASKILEKKIMQKMHQHLNTGYTLTMISRPHCIVSPICFIHLVAGNFWFSGSLPNYTEIQQKNCTPLCCLNMAQIVFYWKARHTHARLDRSLMRQFPVLYMHNKKNSMVVISAEIVGKKW